MSHFGPGTESHAGYFCTQRQLAQCPVPIRKAWSVHGARCGVPVWSLPTCPSPESWGHKGALQAMGFQALCVLRVDTNAKGLGRSHDHDLLGMTVKLRKSLKGGTVVVWGDLRMLTAVPWPPGLQCSLDCILGLLTAQGWPLLAPGRAVARDTAQHPPAHEKALCPLPQQIRSELRCAHGPGEDLCPRVCVPLSEPWNEVLRRK